MNDRFLPQPGAAIAGSFPPSTEWWNFFQQLARASGLSAEKIEALITLIENLDLGALQALAQAQGVGFTVRTPEGWVFRRINGADGRVVVSIGDGVPSNTLVDLAILEVVPGTYGGPSVIPVATIDQWGRVTEIRDHRIGRQVSNFSFGDATPSIFFIAPHDLKVTLGRILITEAFDGAGASIAIGTAGNPTLIQTTSDNDPTTLAGYETQPDIDLSEGDELLLTITPGAGATAGAGQIILDTIPQEGI